jgi:hypothetical protein
VIAIFVIIGKHVGNNDNAKDVKDALTWIYCVGNGVVLCLAFGNYLLFKSGSLYTKPLEMLMSHASFFMAYTAMGITLLQVTKS